MNKKAYIITLAVIIVLLQYCLFLGNFSVGNYFENKERVEFLKNDNAINIMRNSNLKNEIDILLIEKEMEKKQERNRETPPDES